MKSRGLAMGIAVLMGLAGGWAHATPSTVYWSPCSIDIQGFKVVHLGYDAYTTVAKKADKGAFPNDFGLTVGILPFEQVQAEAGFDWMEPTADPLLLNGKIGFPEGALFKGAPALQAGIFNAGVKKDVTNLNVLDLITGMSLPAGLGRVHLGGYLGNKKLLLDTAGEKDNAGFMAGYDLSLFPVESPEGAYSRIVLGADYISGRNVLSGGGAGIYYFFSKNASVLAGPVWFANKALNGEWKWTTQFDANF